MSPLFQPEKFLKQKDFYLLSEIYCREIENMLPVAGSVDFRGPSWRNGQKNKWIDDRDLENQIAAYTLSLCPGLAGNKLILPLHIGDGENIAAVVGDVDSALLGKMADEWLSEFRDSVQERLEKIKTKFIDPVTGLYNSRLLMEQLEKAGITGQEQVLFLISVKHRTGKVTDQFSKTVRAGSFIDASIGVPLFYLGGNVFGLLQDNLTRQESLRNAHRLLRRLKREGLQSVHIGISIPEKAGRRNGADHILEKCWRALETAERRGTFCFCERTYLEENESHPLALPGKQVLSQLRKKWRGKKQFGLILLDMENAPGVAGDESSWCACAASLLPEGVSFIPVSARRGYILVPEQPAGKVLRLAKSIKQQIERKYENGCVDLGICQWPFMHYSKTESAVNCRRAMMHGSFSGPGSVTVFDHVSLNVSGDYFFDEGDYRQAVRDYRIGVQLAPDDTNLLNSLGVALTALNRLREAVVYFDRVLAVDSDDFMALVNMGFAQRMLGEREKAMQYLEKASRHVEFPASGVYDELSLQLARLYCDAGQYADALELLGGLEQKADSPLGYSLFLLLGEAHAGTARNQEAVSFLQKAVRVNPRDAQALSLLGELYALEDQGDEIALSLCRKAVSIDESSWKNWYRLALVQFKMEMLAEAKAAVQKSLKLNRKATEALNLAARIYMHCGEAGRVKSIQNTLMKITRAHPGAARVMPN